LPTGREVESARQQQVVEQPCIDPGRDRDFPIFSEDGKT
jgi:hypothetical protein